MDQTQLQEKIALYYQKLPEETKVLFAGMSWLETLKELDTKYGLNDEQIKTLGTETTILLLGIISPEDYEQTLKTEVKLEGGKTDELIKEINEKILKDISPKLYEAFSNNISELVEEKYGAGFLDKFSKLPEEVRGAINDSSYQASIYEVGNKYALGIDKIGQLEEITTKVLIGGIKAEEYENEVKNKIGLPDDKNKEMVAELNDKIFKNIKELMQNRPIEKWRVPVPPYAKKKMVPKPAAPIIVQNIEMPKEEKEVIKPIIKEYTKEQIDPYKEHGIEILEAEESTPPAKEVEGSEIKNEPVPETTEHKKTNEEIIKSFETKNSAVLNSTPLENIPKNNLNEEIMSNFSKPNILTDKLTKNTISTPTVSNYSLPKMGGGSHDPYHEEI